MVLGSPFLYQVLIRTQVEFEGMLLCLEQQIQNAQSQEDTEEWQAIVEAEFAARVEPVGQDQMAAAVEMRARGAAHHLVEKQFEIDAEQVLQHIHIGQTAVDDFAKEVEHLATMCNDASEADALGVMIEDALTLREHDGHPSIEAIVEAETITGDTVDKCHDRSLDLDYFVHHAGVKAEAHCGSSFLERSHLKKAANHLQELEFHAKAAMALHDESNRLGHHVLHHLKQHTDHQGDEKSRPGIFMNHSLVSLVHEAARGPLLEKQLQRLHRLDEKHYVALHGDTRDAHCSEREDMATHEPSHWSLHNEDVKAYVDCICAQRRPSLVCQAVHADAVARTGELVEAMIQERAGDGSQPDSLVNTAGKAPMSAVQSYTNQSQQRLIPIGPCDTPISCTVCTGPNKAVCMSTPFAMSVEADTPDTAGDLAKNVLNVLKSGLTGANTPCFSVNCEACIGVKPGDFLTFVLSVGASASCDNARVFFHTFNLNLVLSLCFNAGSALKTVLDIFKKSSVCMSLPTLEYYPFIGKMGITYEWRPWWLAKAVQVNAAAYWPVHGLAPAVKSYCWHHHDPAPTKNDAAYMKWYKWYRKWWWPHDAACALVHYKTTNCHWSKQLARAICRQKFLENRKEVYLRVKTYNAWSFSMRTRFEKTWR
ncbi:unnamed protein product [Effrenium voratum]|uniref:Uncharacterized protein n=1 Tax=Effrenium voratum TaxID=2562239 RepID=A0AA36HTV7_9DINO|nr:unnamed protein product [Effrenium voratum]CAJ1451320.1 unnamed protein product [Effrenium voratum]